MRSANLIRETLIFPKHGSGFIRGQTTDAAAAVQGLLVVAPDGRIQFATAQAHLWMSDFFTAKAVTDHLPIELCRWLSVKAPKPASIFIVGRSGKRLNLRMVCREASSFCFLLEQPPSTSGKNETRERLTARETEVLSWVALGKTNAQIGQIMGLKTRTIGKYLERIFPKLGVENRTAAASFTFGTCGDR